MILKYEQHENRFLWIILWRFYELKSQINCFGQGLQPLFHLEVGSMTRFPLSS